jgi:hypothetical protein
LHYPRPKLVARQTNEGQYSGAIITITADLGGVSETQQRGRITIFSDELGYALLAMPAEAVTTLFTTDQRSLVGDEQAPACPNNARPEMRAPNLSSELLLAPGVRFRD